MTLCHLLNGNDPRFFSSDLIFNPPRSCQFMALCLCSFKTRNVMISRWVDASFQFGSASASSRSVDTSPACVARNALICIYLHLDVFWVPAIFHLLLLPERALFSRVRSWMRRSTETTCRKVILFSCMKMRSVFSIFQFTLLTYSSILSHWISSFCAVLCSYTRLWVFHQFSFFVRCFSAFAVFFSIRRSRKFTRSEICALLSGGAIPQYKFIVLSMVEKLQSGTFLAKPAVEICFLISFSQCAAGVTPASRSARLFRLPEICSFWMILSCTFFTV